MWEVIAIMAVQIGTSIINMKYNQKTTAKLKQLQQDFKRESKQRALHRDWEKFRRLCDFQAQLETESHEERLKRIDEDFIDSLDRWAHADAVQSHYPLKISPYIIKKSVIPTGITEIGNTRNEIFCILTGSNDNVFNQDVLPELDQKMCNIISTYWNQQSTHTMCYYENVWNENVTYCNEHIENLKSIIKTPTISITPYFEKRESNNGQPYYELVILVNMWGVGNDNSVLSRIESGYKIEGDNLPIKYSLEQKKGMLNSIFQYAICSLAYNIDVYYWTNYYQPPIFPSLVSREIIKLEEKEIPKLCDAYIQLYESLALGVLSENNQSMALVKDVADINLFSYPERSLNFLSSVSDLSKYGVDVDRLITKSILSIYEARTDERVVNLRNVDVRDLDNEDMKLVSNMIKIAQNVNETDAEIHLIDIISRKIRTWN